MCSAKNSDARPTSSRTTRRTSTMWAPLAPRSQVATNRGAAYSAGARGAAVGRAAPGGPYARTMALDLATQGEALHDLMLALVRCAPADEHPARAPLGVRQSALGGCVTMGSEIVVVGQDR